MQEILNIEYHRQQLLIKALNRYRTRPEQARALGISSRSVIRLIAQYGITKDLFGQYHLPMEKHKIAKLWNYPSQSILHTV